MVVDYLSLGELSKLDYDFIVYLRQAQLLTISGT